MLRFIVKLGNAAVHTNKNIKRDDAVLSLRDLFEFCKWIQYCYAENYEDTGYDESILEQGNEQRIRPEELQALYERLAAATETLRRCGRRMKICVGR